MQAFGYRATKMDDGVLVVHDVPIFAECERGDMVFDSDWIAEAVKKAKGAEGEGYLPPLHIRHHEPATDATDSVRPAGYFRILGAAPITYRGKQRLAVMADLYITNEEAQKEVLHKQLPYRSVEIFNVEDPGLNSLALLDHEAPFLELPMLMVSDVRGGSVPGGTFSRGWSMSASENTAPVVACFSRGNSAVFLMEESMSDSKKQDELFACDPDKDEKMADKPDDEKSEDMAEAPALDVDGVCKAIESGEISVADMDKILASIAQQKGAAAEEEEVEAPAPAAVPGGEAMKADGSESVEFAKMAGKVEALEAELAARKQAEVQREDVAEAMKRLADKPMGSDLEAKLVNFHQKHGAEAFKAHVDSIAETFASVDNDSVTAERFASMDQTVPEVAMKYQADGVDAVERAAKFAAEWQVLSSTGHTRMSQEHYVKLNMEKSNG